MHTLTVKTPIWRWYKTTRHTGPGSWNELSRKQLLQVAEIISTEPDTDKQKVKLTKALFGLKWHHIFLMSPEQLAYLNTFFGFILKGNELTDNKILHIRQGRDKYYGPLGDFSTLTAKEWTAADGAFLEYCRSGEEEQLDLLIAILWRPKQGSASSKSEDWRGDYRMPFNQFTAEFRAKRFTKLDRRIKLAILIWYRGCRQEWEQFYERVFSGSGAEQVENYGWMETIQKMSGTSFGNLHDTELTPMWKLLLKMQIDIKDQEIAKANERTR
jgi:hypothetical protein